MNNKLSNLLLVIILLINSALPKSSQDIQSDINTRNKELNKIKNEKSYLYLSKIFNEQEKKELEERNLNTVILLNPKNEEATYNLAQLKLKESDFEGSKKLIEKLLIFCKNYCQKSQKLKIEIEKSLKK